ncbi:MAG: biotin carboxylase N-terminal domain-containing protein [Methanopyri archaeon]|nr:biotin carboxylase N-terminal domain-containing protein [Methanopyri archaeon]
MFKKILIANRGAIASRVIKACQEMGIHTIAIYSDADERSVHMKLADESHHLGESSPLESYMNIDKLLDVARKSGAEAIHPGYGFLSENPEFAQRCEEAGLSFIGPRSDVIRDMGCKIRSKQIMEKAGIPTIPGYHGDDQDNERLLEEADVIGFPIMIKAAAGGGGKGIRIVHDRKEFISAAESAAREAISAFGDGKLLLEKFIIDPRHIEFQILADRFGHTVHLLERECSIQRRHQKIIEETPSLALSSDLRESMGEAAVKVAQTVGYTNAGTVEFMLSGKDYYFLEMNTRLQVEHAITEATSGIDIVKWQIRIAADERLTIQQSEVKSRGHAIECRIYAEDPEKSFLPSTGTLHQLSIPLGGNIRHELGIEKGSEITHHYDPMLAKLIVHAENRDEAIDKMLWALSNYSALGVTTNIPFLKEISRHAAFRRGQTDTNFIEKYFSDWPKGREAPPKEAIIAASIFDMLEGTRSVQNEGTFLEADPYSPWKDCGNWRIS